MSQREREQIQTTSSNNGNCRPHRTADRTDGMGAGFGKCRNCRFFRQIFPFGKMEERQLPWHVILVAGPPAAGKLGGQKDVHRVFDHGFLRVVVQKDPRDVHLSPPVQAGKTAVHCSPCDVF